MTPLSLYVYGSYLILNGLLMLLIPEFALSLVGLEIGADTWIRVVGVLATEIGVYFVVAARKGISEFYLVSVYARFGVATAFLGLVLAGLAPQQLLLFCAVDVLSAVWTQMTLRGAANEVSVLR